MSRVAAVIMATVMLALAPGCARRVTRPEDATLRALGPRAQTVQAGPISFVSPIPLEHPEARTAPDDLDGVMVRVESADASSGRLAVGAISLTRDAVWTGNRAARMEHILRALTGAFEETAQIEVSHGPMDQHDGVISVETRATLRAQSGGAIGIWARAVMTTHRIGAVMVVGDEPWVQRTSETVQLRVASDERFVAAGDGQWRSELAWQHAWPLTFACLMPPGLSPDDEHASSWATGSETRRFRARVVAGRTAAQLRDEARSGSSEVVTAIIRGTPAYRVSSRDERGWSETLVWDEHVFSIAGTGAPDGTALSDAERFLGSCVPL